jgi:ABC-type transport system involved in cytochrome c biogenesis ATPase subunit
LKGLIDVKNTAVYTAAKNATTYVGHLAGIKPDRPAIGLRFQDRKVWKLCAGDFENLIVNI